jgi:hypothetical protein
MTVAQLEPCTPADRLRRVSAARRRRGAVYVESVVVSMMLALMLGGVFFFHKLYAGKLFTLRQARLQAWSTAYGGSCGGAVTNAALNMVKTAWEAGENVCSGVTGNDCESGGALGLSMGFDQGGATPDWAASGQGNGSEQVAVATRGSGSGPLTPNWSGSVSTRTAVGCDETPQQGERPNMPDVVTYAAELFFSGNTFKE